MAFLAERWGMSRAEVLAEPAWFIARAVDVLTADIKTPDAAGDAFRRPPAEDVPDELLSGMQLAS